MKHIIRSLIVGMVIGMAVLLIVGVVCIIRADITTALRWSSNAAFLLGAVCLTFAGMRWFSADKDGGAYFRPGRSALELEAEVLNEHRDRAKNEGKNGERKASSFWVAIGVFLTGLLPELLLMLF